MQTIIRTTFKGKMIESVIDSASLEHLIPKLNEFLSSNKMETLPFNVSNIRVHLNKSFLCNYSRALHHVMTRIRPDAKYLLETCYLFGHMCSLASLEGSDVYIVEDVDAATTTNYGPGHYFVGDLKHFCELDLPDEGEFLLEDGAVVRQFKLSDQHYVDDIHIIRDTDNNDFRCPSGYIGIIRRDYIPTQILNKLEEEMMNEVIDDEYHEPCGFTFIHAVEPFRVKSTMLTIEDDYDIQAIVFGDIQIEHTFQSKSC